MSRANGGAPTFRRCPVTHQSADQEDFEHDFTTQGKVGNLECPFAKMAQNGLHTPNSQQDPIAAEFHQDKMSTVSPPLPGPVGVCPIRFLDKHSPEEIAQYFENHKHEIPRSHEVCVKRYQKNEQGIRALDAKYGSLVNMIQGLGNKHKQYLPEAEQAVKEEDSVTNQAMERWGEGVSKSVIQSEEVENGDELRESRFQRPLREIRVGESPSRPWGISVPVGEEIPLSAMASEENRKQKASPQNFHASIPGASGALPKPAIDIEPDSQQIFNQPRISESAEESRKHEGPVQIVFNGPVFFGYSPEDAAKFLKALNLGDIQSKPS